jgi:hypothetical protein
MKTLISLCKQLQLSFTAESIATACEQVQRQQPSYIEFLTELLSREHEARTDKPVILLTGHQLGSLICYDRPKSDIRQYDALLGGQL